MNYSVERKVEAFMVLVWPKDTPPSGPARLVSILCRGEIAILFAPVYI